MVMGAKDTAYNILIDLNAEGHCDLMCYSRATPSDCAVRIDDFVNEPKHYVGFESQLAGEFLECEKIVERR